MIDLYEAIKFFKVQLNRCKINLRGATERRDERAIQNIQHKMEVYQYVIQRLQDER